MSITTGRGSQRLRTAGAAIRGLSLVLRIEIVPEAVSMPAEVRH